MPKSDLERAWSIAEVERDTGLGKDTLRVWEKRYGFPVPERDAVGQRVYSPSAVHRLRQIAALLRSGHRPGRVVPMSDVQREELLDAPRTKGGEGEPGQAGGAVPEVPSAALVAALAALKSRDGTELRRQLQQASRRIGLADFVTTLLAPLTTAVGDGWMKGELRVADEHLFTEVAHNVLRQNLMGLPEAAKEAAPRVLLTTLPGEPHGLGLLMAEAMCALEGAYCINLGPQTPLDEIVAAAQWHRVHVVGLSATGCMPVRAIAHGLRELRLLLPQETALWVGGSAAAGLRSVAGVVRLLDLRSIGRALAEATAPE